MAPTSHCSARSRGVSRNMYRSAPIATIAMLFTTTPTILPVSACASDVSFSSVNWYLFHTFTPLDVSNLYGSESLRSATFCPQP